MALKSLAISRLSSFERLLISAEDDIFDDLFNGYAPAGFMQIALATGNWPDPEATKRRAYELYEEALAEKNTCSSG
jgi:hypothetical protein